MPAILLLDESQTAVEGAGPRGAASRRADHAHHYEATPHHAGTVAFRQIGKQDVTTP